MFRLQIGRLLFDWVSKETLERASGIVCKAIQNLPNPQGEHVKGLGNGCDSSVCVSHITPKHHSAVTRLVGRNVL